MIMNINKLRTEYNERIPLLKQLGVQAKQILSREITRKKIRIHSLQGRVKGFSSFCDKIRGRRIEDPFREIEDLVGLRVVCLFLSDLPKMASIIRGSFQIIREDDKIATIGADIFGYLAVHFNVRLKEAHADLRYDVLRDTTFEIQVRTITHDAWASISHYLEYKKPGRIPDHLKRDFYALSGLFYVADTHFDLLRANDKLF